MLFIALSRREFGGAAKSEELLLLEERKRLERGRLHGGWIDSKVGERDSSGCVSRGGERSFVVGERSVCISHRPGERRVPKKMDVVRRSLLIRG